jgi:hypothetical protein
MVEKRNAYKMVVVGKPKGKRPLGRPSRREDKINIYLR